VLEEREEDATTLATQPSMGVEHCVMMQPHEIALSVPEDLLKPRTFGFAANSA
jgi:hypothetical protein